MGVDLVVLAERSRPGSIAYDAQILEDYGARLRVPGRRALGPVRKIRDVIEHRSGVLWEESLRSLGGRADAVLALLEQFALAPQALKRARINPYGGARIAMLSCWLADNLRRADRNGRERLMRQYAGIDLIFFLSVNQEEIFAASGFRREQLAAIPFGVDPRVSDFVELERDIPVLAVGFDRGRDYGTFFSAIERIDTKAIVHCKAANLDGRNRPTNVDVRGQIPYDEYRRLLLRAQVVVVPTYDLAYPTGQSVALEAASSGACVVASATAPLKEYFQDGETALLAAVGDAEGLQFQIARALDDEALRRRIAEASRADVLGRFTTRHMWSAAATVMRDRLDLDLAPVRR